MQERIIELESRLAHQDHLLQTLNDVVTDQQSRLMQLETLCRSMADRLQAIGEMMPATGGGDDEPPPHY
ncbi:MAG: SlyX family protein [Pseudomonadota bacterium]